MANKVIISERQARQFNKMLESLKTIAKRYQTPEQLRRSSEKRIGLEFEEALEMAYENIQQEARGASHGIVKIKLNHLINEKETTTIA